MMDAILHGKPKNNCYYLLETFGDIKQPIICNSDTPSKFLTNIECKVYNEETDRITIKSAYLGKHQKLFLIGKIGKQSKRLYLEDFKE